MNQTINKNLFNLDILILSKEVLRQLGRVSKTNIFESASQNFEPEGLFSTTIFGQVGSQDRTTRFGYVDLRIKVYHPLVYNHLCTLRSFYKDVMYGKKYAKYDNELKDIVPASMEDGETGFTYFTSILPKIKFDHKDSDQREFKIKLVEKYSNPDTMLGAWLVLPAGLRDYVVSDDGKASDDEINDLYRKLITTTNLLNNVRLTPTTEYTVDTIKIKIQELVHEIYEYIRVLLDGKNKFIQGKWAKRSVMNGSRNVLTPTVPNITNLKQEHKTTIDHTVIGLYQYIRSILPITMNKLNVNFIGRLMSAESTSAKLVNPKTMKTELVDIPIKKRDDWVTMEGLDSLLGKLKQPEVRDNPVMVGDYYLLLIHDKNDVITIIDDTTTMNEELDPKYIRPITYYELLYIAIYEVKDKYPALITRYPVANLGGIYPSKLFVRTTENPRTVTVIRNGISTKVYEYPNFKGSYVNSVSVHNSHLATLGADHDGDVISVNVMYTEHDSVKEINDYLNSKEYFINPAGGLTYSVKSSTLEYVVKHLTNGV